MYNPLPHLPNRFRKIIHGLRKKKLHPRIIFFTLGILATLWFLIRVIPKPSRASYPCMQATAPFMSAFVLYLLSLGGTVLALKRFRLYFIRTNYVYALLFLMAGVSFYFLSYTFMPKISVANKLSQNINYFTPNAPIGVAKGIFPGRVVWYWNPNATNENCTNTSNANGVIDPDDDGWFMSKNNNAQVIDTMIIKSLVALTGALDNNDAWDKIFRFYNIKNGNGNSGYSAGQKIFIKINATSVNSGLASGKYYPDLSRNDNLILNPFAAETNPFIVLSVIRQLVNNAHVPQYLIYIGDPARNIYKEHYDLWHSEFPDVHYLGNNLIHPELDLPGLGRTPVEVTANDKVFFSDHGAVMTDAVTDKLFTIFEEMDYLINIPTMKAHATAGISVAAKNHFGSFTREWAMHLHKGLFDNNDDPVRLGYGLYRVQTDIMMHNLLSGKNLLILVDALYPGEDAGGVPEKWVSPPFYNDWCSSIFTSLDPVAIESVCHDFLRTEYNGSTIAESRPNWYGVDDYLHQAADSSLWADNVIYDPDNDGILFASLGVHEHWNDSLRKEYTRNLLTGDGIDLYKVHEHTIGITELNQVQVRIYPNPATDFINISNEENSILFFTLTNSSGKTLQSGKIKSQTILQIDLTSYPDGVYFICLNTIRKQHAFKIVKQE